MDVYVLTAKQETGEWGPVAVVTQEHVANEWLNSGPDRDWVPLTINDLSNTGMAAKTKTEFKPVPPKRRQEITNETINKTRNNLQESSRLLEQALKKKQRSHVVRASARVAGNKATMDELAQSILNDYLGEMGDADPKLDSFRQYVNMRFRDRNFTNLAVQKYVEMFGHK